MSLETGPANGGRSDVDTIPPQPTVMVTGTAGREMRSVAMQLFDGRAAKADGAVVVTTRESPAAVVRRLIGGPGEFDGDQLAVVDASGADDDERPDVGLLECVDPGADPEPVNETVTAGLEWLAAAGVERRHFLYDTLAADDRLQGPEAVYDRAYRIAMTVGAEDGLGLFTLDDDGLSVDVVERLGHLFDVTVEVRERRGETELRWTGLLGASDGWVSLADADLGLGGFR